MSSTPPEAVDYKRLLANHLRPPGEFQACFAFSIHKAGSTLMNAMIQDVCRQAAIPAISIPDRLFAEGIGESWANDKRVLEVIEEGRVYHGFRYLAPVLLHPGLRLNERRSVLLVRDPRDALVSEYFSYGGRHHSHRLPEKNREKFAERSEATKHLDIDEYVVAAAYGYRTKLDSYRKHLDLGRILLRRYEDIYFDKHKFLSEIFEHFRIPVAPAILARVSAANDLRPDAEDPSKHVRKGTPGDHREKLKLETIGTLNEMFRESGAAFGYHFES
jgi:hypothetical protein